MKTLALFLIPIATLAACASTTASLTPEQCAADWNAVGYADGRDGEDIHRIEAYRNACANGGAPLSERDESDWVEGWNAAQRAGAPARDDDPRYEDDDDDDRGGGGTYPVIYPQIGVGVGSGGVSVGGGLGIGLGGFSLGIYN